ncbi:FAD-binding protein [Kitasatospora mediocidica]|uniref:FAD-binding protein n=1 Tax=Kitasatospora mediocidica TaxID=58352 RepID=UPI00056C7512|nr:FAD-binding protein [Kitasatospora mediocidica]
MPADPAHLPPANWAGNLRYSAARFHRPTSVEELSALVRSAARVRAVGSRHSFNALADTTGDLVSTAGLPRVLRIAPDRRSVRVSGGLRYAEIAEELEASGLALANLASLPHISVAGAVATGTHGSGDRNQGLASAVLALELVDADGKLRALDREADPDLFPAAVVALGALGIVTELTLAVEPSFQVAQTVHLDLALDRLAADFDEVFAAAYSVSAFTDWAGGRAAVWTKHRTDAAEPPGSPAGAVAAGTPQHPIPGVPAVNCTAQLGQPGPWHDRLPHFRAAFTPSSGDELQSEYLLPRGLAAEGIARLTALGPQLAPALHISEIRTVAADELWLSPAFRRDSVAFHFTWVADQSRVAPLIIAVEEALLPLGARPHWGKLFSCTPSQLAEAVPRLADFATLARGLDPDGKFRNELLDDWLSGTGG